MDLKELVGWNFVTEIDGTNELLVNQSVPRCHTTHKQLKIEQSFGIDRS